MGVFYCFIMIKRYKKSSSLLITEMFMDPWISDYSMVGDITSRYLLTRHLSSVTQGTVEMRARGSKSTASHSEEIVLHF
jgi:hypothetical protein